MTICESLSLMIKKATSIKNNFIGNIASVYLISTAFKQKQDLMDLLNFPEIYEASLRSSLAYCEKEEILKKWLKARTNPEICNDIETCVLQKIIDEPIFFDDNITSAQAIILYDREKQIIYLTFRGTDDLKDWIYDLDTKLKPMTHNISKALVHSGFLKQFESLISKIEEALNNMEFNTIFISGHSLGAALASIASVYFQNHHSDKDIILYVFGSPRCGNQEFTNLVTKNVKRFCRVVNETDPINEVPFGKTYQHIGNCLTIKSNGTARLSDEDTPWSKRLLTMLMTLDISDHLMFGGYIANLKKLL